jgi:triacylglycerol esterase/lipase EstA (alpha/beta hydrolase family)
VFAHLGFRVAETKETVVFVHGLYMTGLELSLLRLRVGQAGFDAHQFHYHTVLEPVRVNAQRLADYIAGLKVKTLHLVGHSLGGLVILRMLESSAETPPGRVVLLGSPVKGSLAARNLVAKHLGWILGRSGPDGLAEEYDPQWHGQRELGVIAGTGGFGLNPLRPDLPEPHDGLVAVEETRLAGVADYVEVKTTHTGLLFNPEVAEQVIAFLHGGKFSSWKR